MKSFTVLSFVVVITLVALAALLWFNGAFDAATALPAPNDSTAQADSTQGGQVEQVIQKVIPKGPPAPEIASSTWLNSPALSTADLRDHVVVVEFWTYG